MLYKHFIINASSSTLLYKHEFPFQVEFADIHDAKEQVKLGQAWGAVYLGSEFTMDLLKRVCSVSKCPSTVPAPDNTTINGSTIHLFADVTSENIFLKIELIVKLFFSPRV